MTNQKVRNLMMVLFGAMLSLGYTMEAQSQIDPNDYCPPPSSYEPNDPNYVWDFFNDFSPWKPDYAVAENPHREWSYGRGSDLIDFLLNDIPYLNESYPCFTWIHGDDTVPVIWKNFRERIHGAEMCEVSMHPAQPWKTYYLAKVRWTSPFNDSINISGMFKKGHSGAVDLWIVKDGDSNKVLFYKVQTYDDEPFDLFVKVGIGTTIDFVLGPGPSYTSDTVPLDVQISRITQSCESVGIFLPDDLNTDCYINLLDLAVLAGDWPNDFNLLDLASLAGDWLNCNDPKEPACWP